MSKQIDYSKGVYDARQLGTGRMLILGVQHMFAMFGASVLVPFLFGISPAIVLLMNGVGTLLFIFITKGKGTGLFGLQFCLPFTGSSGDQQVWI